MNEKMKMSGRLVYLKGYSRSMQKEKETQGKKGERHFK